MNEECSACGRITWEVPKASDWHLIEKGCDLCGGPIYSRSPAPKEPGIWRIVRDTVGILAAVPFGMKR